MSESKVKWAIIHNETVGPVVKAIVKPTIDTGGGAAQILVILESTVLGVLMLLQTVFKWEPHQALLTLSAGVSRRLQEKGYANRDSGETRDPPSQA